MADVSCSRCGSVAAGLERAPLPGPAGALVLRQTCSDCWGEWIKAQVILMNENRWTPANPDHFNALIEHMKTYLSLREESAPAPSKGPRRFPSIDTENAPVEAITFDFYNTLAFHASGLGRGQSLMHYISRQGLECDPWEHQILYDAFDRHDRDYDPGAAPAERRRYRLGFTERLFRRLEVKGARAAAAAHAEAVWRLLGPDAFAVFSDVEPVLNALHASGYPLAVVSNWQRGLGHFCDELGIGQRFEFVLASAEVGVDKPDPGIFAEAARRLGASPQAVLHVGDSPTEDQRGAWGAGGRSLLLRRGDSTADRAGGQEPSVVSLAQLPALLESGQQVGLQPPG